MIAKLAELGVICLCTLPLLVLLRRSWKRPLPREIVLVLFLTFMTGILALALDGEWKSPAEMLHSALERLKTGERISFTPFATIGRQLRKLPTSPEQQLTQLLGNTLLFIPWGFCLPLLWRRFRTLPRLIALSLLLTCFIEFTQLFIGREVDIDDVLLNFLASMLGAGAWRLLCRRFPEADHLSR